ncbi:MAG TPA: hypothetical protein PLW35_09140 [Verrucomicrobiota bacterium]|nr:hypothetical protein [Verrucomicrobiota bacterium]
MAIFVRQERAFSTRERLYSLISKAALFKGTLGPRQAVVKAEALEIRPQPHHEGHEADDYAAGLLESWGYDVQREAVPVQAFRRDTSKPLQHQYSRPMPEDPWYTPYNLYAERKSRSRPSEIIVVLAHKHSQLNVVMCPMQP